MEADEFRPLNDEAFVIKYLAYVKRYGLIDFVEKNLGLDAGLLKRWVQYE